MTIISAVVLSLAAGYLLSKYTPARLPYLDAHVMIFSVLATWMLAHKIIETWIYWIVIDMAAMTLYWSTGYYVTILLFMSYVVLSVYGYLSWRKASREI
jgi:nicotinamide mononucleotide transporter